LRNGIFDVHVSSAGGAVKELDHKPLGVNLGNTMSRIREDYHRKLTKGYSSRIKEARKAVMRGDFVDVHDLLGVGERGLAKVLRYDDYQRASFLTHVLSERRSWKDMQKFRGSIDSFLKGQYSSVTEVGSDSISQVLSRRDKVFVDNGRAFDLEIIKKITMGRGPSIIFSHGIRKHSGGNLCLRYALEFNFLVWDKTVISRPKMARTNSLFLKDMHSGVGIDFRLENEATVFSYPVFTVNETESGLRKTFQGISVLLGDEFMPSGSDNEREINVIISVR
jgi:alpha-amylase